MSSSSSSSSSSYPLVRCDTCGITVYHAMSNPFPCLPYTLFQLTSVDMQLPSSSSSLPSVSMSEFASYFAMTLCNTCNHSDPIVRKALEVHYFLQRIVLVHGSVHIITEEFKRGIFNTVFNIQEDRPSPSVRLATHPVVGPSFKIHGSSELHEYLSAPPSQLSSSTAMHHQQSTSGDEVEEEEVIHEEDECGNIVVPSDEIECSPGALLEDLIDDEDWLENIRIQDRMLFSSSQQSDSFSQQE